jgi:hypothetical protein
MAAGYQGLCDAAHEAWHACTICNRLHAENIRPLVELVVPFIEL